MFSAHAHIDLTTFTQSCQNWSIGSLLALYGSTKHPAQLCHGFQTIFFCLVCGLLEKKKNRKQFIVLNGEKSHTCQVVSGVSQGSVLGPLLFLVYINDSVEATQCEGNTITLFTDDMLLYRVINNTHDLEVVQQGINNVGKWVDSNNLSLNPTKCKFTVISGLRSRCIQVPTLLLNGYELKKVLEYKYLGVILTISHGQYMWTPWSARLESLLACSIDSSTVGPALKPFIKYTSPWFDHTWGMQPLYGVLTLLKTSVNLKQYKSLLSECV